MIQILILFSVCPPRNVSKAEPWVIAVSIVGAILLIGLLLILLLRLYIWWLDKREFAEFKKRTTADEMGDGKNSSLFQI